MGVINESPEKRIIESQLSMNKRDSTILAQDLLVPLVDDSFQNHPTVRDVTHMKNSLNNQQMKEFYHSGSLQGKFIAEHKRTTLNESAENMSSYHITRPVMNDASQYVENEVVESSRSNDHRKTKLSSIIATALLSKQNSNDGKR